MIKFLGGDSYDGTRVPVCTYWSETQTTDPDVDYATITTEPNSGNCIANAFFRRDQISCFNEGKCNGEGKCLPCTKYKYGGMRLAITHSPPLEILRQFNGGLTEEEIKSPNLAAFPSEIVAQIAQDQVPYHIVIRNIQAKIAKCCHWNQGNGNPAQFYLATILDGPDTVTLTGADGQQTTYKGIKVTHPEFPDDEGTFFPIGTVVVAGFSDEPSFYLEPRTGLIKPGEGIIFPPNQESPVSVRIKQKATSATRITIDITNAIIGICASLNTELNRIADLVDNANTTQNLLVVDELTAKQDDLQTRQGTACDAATNAQTKAQDILDLIDQIVHESDLDNLSDLSSQLSTAMNDLADLADSAIAVGLGDSAERLAGNLVGILRQIARDITQASFRSFSKCEFFFEDDNIAAQWNNPTDGSLPCNGIRTECQFYTGQEWQYATDENLEVGKAVKAEALQELRWRSDDWGRFDNPSEEFRNRFTTPFIWAFKNYVDVNGQPDLQDMALYKPKVLFGRGTDLGQFQTMQLKKVEISDFSNFTLAKSTHRIQPGSHTLDKDKVPDYPTVISSLSVPVVNRLRITHPPTGGGPFIYRSWSPDKNKITLFGTGTPEATVYLVNETALRERSRYHTYLGTSNFVTDLPIALPGAPSFTYTTPAQLQQFFQKLEDEKKQSDSEAPLGFDHVTIETTGFWRATQSIDLVHNEINKIFVFVLVDSTTFVFDSVEIDYRFLHSIPVQISFSGKDFTIQDDSGSTLASAASDIVRQGVLNASTRQIVGKETVSFNAGYYGLRFKDRGLKSNQGLNADNDLQFDTLVVNDTPSPVSATSSNQITSVGYSVFQYRKKNVAIEDWYVLDNCGSIMIVIPDNTAHRVLPLPDTTGINQPLENVLIDGGSTGSIVAQFALEEASIITELGKKKLVQVYRDPDGNGLPANYILLGPSTDVKEAFGRPDPDTDTIEISYTYLQAETVGPDASPASPQNDDELVSDNFYNDTLRLREHSVNFASDGSLSVGDDKSEGEGQNAITTGDIKDLTQEYVWVFKDSEGRPIGRKYSRLLVMYYGLSCINTEIYYAWEGSCSTFGLIPDKSLVIGDGNGTLIVQPRGTTDPSELQLGFRLANSILGTGQKCIYKPSCGDHEFLGFGLLREEFEVIADVPDIGLKAIQISAGAPIEGDIVSSLAPKTQFNIRQGPLWYPYTLCEKPRYTLRNSIGPEGARSTELINKQTQSAGFQIGANVLSDSAVKSTGGTFAGLQPTYDEAYRGPDLVEALVLDIHPSLEACTSAYTYGNRVLDGRIAKFVGASRKRGQVAVDVYGDKGWSTPPFGNLGRNLLFAEVSDRRGDYITDANSISFRWMPIFPERENLGAGINLFTEDLESQLYRQLQLSSPLGEIAETVDLDSLERFTQKALIRNAPIGGVDYPFLGFFPLFLSDNLLGKEPATRKALSPTENITTMWAWREQEKAVGRAQSGKLLTGVKVQAPEYILDNRGLEVRLRPAEGAHTLSFKPPVYDQETGEIIENHNGYFQLDNGPQREIKIDFANKSLTLANQEDSVYDTSLDIGDSPFPCQEGTSPDNENFSATCTCEKDVSADTVDADSLPSRFLHLDEQAPEGYFSLYEKSTLETPFAAPLTRTDIDQPCCQCVYYIRGLFLALDVEYLPSTDSIDPGRDGRVKSQYTWSRVPHGDPQGRGQDGAFAGNEPLADSYTDFASGNVFTNSIIPDNQTLSVEENLAALFPGSQYALAANADGNPIQVTALPTAELKFGGGPAVHGISFGEDEQIILAFRFDTYVQIDSIDINFFLGSGWEIPKFTLAAVDPENRGPSAGRATLRTGRVLAQNTIAYVENDTEVHSSAEKLILQRGLSAGLGLSKTITLNPSYIDNAFWNRYAMEFLLIFEPRNSNTSMGISAISLDVSAFISTDVKREGIQVYERKYYRSSASPAGTVNPEGRLSGVDSASAYWLATSQNYEAGANKYRAYVWGDSIEDNQGFTFANEPKDLEKLQEEEYRKTATSFNQPNITFKYIGFLPKEEHAAVNFYGGKLPTWTNTLTLTLSELKDVKLGGTDDGELLYGEIPERKAWSAPGHAWTFKTEDAYLVCDSTASTSSMVVNFNFAHLHDNLEVVETASFWEELPSGFTQLLRSTEGSPDPFFGQGSATSPDGTNPGGTGQAQLLSEKSFENIPTSVLEKAGFRRDADGSLIRVVQGGE